VKSFSLFKLPILLAGFGALLLFSPTCKAQSAVSPDHFDGTDTWEVAARKPVTSKAKAPATASYQTNNQKLAPARAFNLLPYGICPIPCHETPRRFRTGANRRSANPTRNNSGDPRDGKEVA